MKTKEKDDKKCEEKEKKKPGKKKPEKNITKTTKTKFPFFVSSFLQHCALCYLSSVF